MFFDLAISSLQVAIFGILTAFALFIAVLFALRFFNRYNVRNAWFILVSIIGIPFLIVEFTLVFALLKIRSSIVVDAHEYACSLASQVDNAKQTAATFVHQQVTERVEQSADVIGDNIKDRSDKLIDDKSLSGKAGNQEIEGALSSIARNGTDMALNAASGAVVNAASGIVNTAIDYIPDNPVGLVLEKFPILSKFLNDNDIEGVNATEIVDSLFVKINNYILSRILGCLKWVGFFLLLQCSFSILFGNMKKRKKEREQQQIVQAQEALQSLKTDNN